MKVLISNDDGVHAPGIKCLHKHLKEDFDTFIVAPLEERSTTGHTLSLDNPLRIAQIDDNIFGCSGYPADCSLMGFGFLMKEKPNVVISGINRGANLGQDIYYSGTVAAAREGVFHGIPGIAISLDCDFHAPTSEGLHFDSAGLFIKKFLSDELLNLLSPNHLININVPDLPYKNIKGVKYTSLGFRRYSEEITSRTDFRGRDYFWIGGVYQGFEAREGSDCKVVDDGLISVSILNLLGQRPDKEDKWQRYIEDFSL